MMKCIKKALIRDNSVPVGQPAPLHVNCFCGKECPITTSVNTCECGVIYDDRGYIQEAE